MMKLEYGLQPAKMYLVWYWNLVLLMLWLNVCGQRFPSFLSSIGNRLLSLYVLNLNGIKRYTHNGRV